MPSTHQESDAISRPVVRSSFARLGTYTSSLTLTLSPYKVQDYSVTQTFKHNPQYCGLQILDL
ncbi:hypothetical protein Hanom_Chr07g00641551 [Helianthus anomalus]